MYITDADRLLGHVSGDTRAARKEALEILEQALQSVCPARAITNTVSVKHDRLTVCGHTYDLAKYQHRYLVGFGKASVGMARALLSMMTTAPILDLPMFLKEVAVHGTRWPN